MIRESRWIGLCAVGLAAWAMAMQPVAAQARPLRGPLLRAERRLARAQAALDREAAPASNVAKVPKPAEPPKAAASSPRAAAPSQAASSGVTRTGYEAPVRPVPTPAFAAASPAAEPAADGTVSVLVRPETPKADQPVEPLRFPDASAP